MSPAIGIFYFSGTGNTAIIADLFEKEFKNSGAEVDKIKVEDVLLKKNHTDDTNNTDKYDIIGIGYPVHAFSAPRIIFNFIRKMPAAKNKKVFLFKSAGDFALDGGSTSMIRSRLKRKGYNVFYESLYIISSNLVIRYNDELIKQLYNDAYIKVVKAAGEITAGKVKLQKNSIPTRFLTRIVSGPENLGAHFMRFHIKFSKSCIKCGKCVKNCPAGNLRNIRGKNKPGWKCILCLRCIYNCPKKAISLWLFNWALIKGAYDIRKILSNPGLKGDYINDKTTGYYKRFYKYLNT